MRRLGTISSEVSEGLPWRQALWLSNGIFAATGEHLVAFELERPELARSFRVVDIPYRIRWRRPLPYPKVSHHFLLSRSSRGLANLVLQSPDGIEAIDAETGQSRWRSPASGLNSWSLYETELWGSVRSDPFVSSMTLAREGDPMVDSRGRAINASLCGHAEIRRWDLSTGRELPALKLSGAPRGAAMSLQNPRQGYVLAGNRALSFEMGAQAKQLFKLPYQPAESWRLMACCKRGLIFDDPSGEVTLLDFKGVHQWTATRRDDFSPAGASSPLVVGDGLIQVDLHGQIRALDLKTGQRHWTTEATEYSGYPLSVPILIDNRRILAQTGFETLAVHEISRGERLEQHSSKGPISTIAVGPVGQMLVLGQDIDIFVD